MKFSTREDIEAPIEQVFEDLCTFGIYERAAMRRGIDVQRRDRMEHAGVGAKWHAAFSFRGKPRDIELEITTFAPPDDLVVHISSKGIFGEMSFELIALSRQRTRMLIGLDIRPQTLPARVLFQSLKLTKPALNRRYKDRVSALVADMQDRVRPTG